MNVTRPLRRVSLPPSHHYSGQSQLGYGPPFPAALSRLRMDSSHVLHQECSYGLGALTHLGVNCLLSGDATTVLLCKDGTVKDSSAKALSI